ncbi:hypothetical protein K435DRAFT_272484 [Dendrothele bispora CBS 962.96]|uniref:DUF6534 domain-containing protein n=1 Tax=Dendrothele bispora (strain CBS 962.96) TaxID=1314807 RepID=A0A4S8LN09_DENBC|nr:hypothetical protein K435DRAFT_272484 [Dendrothele bispora CBS 962.96]
MSNGTATLPNEGVSVSEVGSPIFFGSIISLILMGVTVVQSWTYFNNNRDSLRLRCFVSTIVVLNIACTCLLIVELYSHLILHFGSDPMLVVLPTKSLGVELLLNIFIIILVDFFLANQIRNLGQTHWSVVVVVVFAATVAFGIVFSTCTMSLASPSLSEVLFATQLGLGLIGTGNALFTCAEVVASIALAWSLHHSKTGIRRTDGILTKLFTWMVTRGLLLSVIQVLSMAFYFANPLSPHWIPFHLLQSKLYVITTLSLYVYSTPRPQVGKQVFTLLFEISSDSILASLYDAK